MGTIGPVSTGLGQLHPALYFDVCVQLHDCSLGVLIWGFLQSANMQLSKGAEVPTHMHTHS